MHTGSSWCLWGRGIFHEYTYLECRLEVFGVLKGLIEDSCQPLVKIPALLHETHVVTLEILRTRRQQKENQSISFLHADPEFNSATWERKKILEKFHF